jgi:hypothetical protein
MFFQVALKPLSLISVVCGNMLLEKLGCFQADSMSTIVVLPTRVKNNCSDPLI